MSKNELMSLLGELGDDSAEVKVMGNGARIHDSLPYISDVLCRRNNDGNIEVILLAEEVF